jgi:hypothetical protein
MAEFDEFDLLRPVDASLLLPFSLVLGIGSYGVDVAERLASVRRGASRDGAV